MCACVWRWRRQTKLNRSFDKSFQLFLCSTTSFSFRAEKKKCLWLHIGLLLMACGERTNEYAVHFVPYTRRILFRLFFSCSVFCSVSFHLIRGNGKGQQVNEGTEKTIKKNSTNSVYMSLCNTRTRVRGSCSYCRVASATAKTVATGWRK